MNVAFAGTQNYSMQPNFMGGVSPTGFDPMSMSMMLSQMSQMIMMMQMMMGMMSSAGLGNFGSPASMNPAFNNLMGVPGTGASWPQAFPLGMQQGAGFPGACGCGPTGQLGSYTGPINVERLVASVPGELQKNARKHFPGILAECQKQGVQDRAQIAYILATTCHESNAGGAMTEFASGCSYEGRSDLGNCYGGDGVRFKGRGYVQITGRRNYADWSKKLGVDLVGNPERARDPQIAAAILVGGMKDGTFTGRKLGDYVGNGRSDFHNARRVVNGTDRAGHIGNIAQRLLAAM